jgi:probable rRNA maturation factor
MIRVQIANPQESVPIDRARLREVVRKVLEEEHVREARISLAFVDNATIQQLNKRYLNHDAPTDILSFPLSEDKLSPLAGELVLGAEVAKEQALARGHDVQAELALYVIHGILHLCGYDDKDPRAVEKMRTRERHHLSALGLPNIAPDEE